MLGGWVGAWSGEGEGEEGGAGEEGALEIHCCSFGVDLGRGRVSSFCIVSWEGRYCVGEEARYRSRVERISEKRRKML